MINNLKNLITSKGLLGNLIKKELKVKYNSSALGFFWSLLNPLLMMLVFTIVFSKMLAFFEVENYPIFLLCALLPWNFLNIGLMSSVGSIIGNANLVKKTFFPREALPMSTVIAHFINFLLSLPIFFILLTLFRYDYYFYLPILVIVILLQLIFVTGLALLFSCINVFFRDTQHFIEIILLVWYFITPIFYPIKIIPSRFIFIYKLNPMAGYVSVYRDLLYNTKMPSIETLIYLAVVSVLIFSVSYIIFYRFEPVFAEEV